MARLRRRLGAARVDDLLSVATRVARSHLAGDEDLVFGFLQRVLVQLNNEGRHHGLIFPKRDGEYRPMFDYFDGDGRIYVIYPGEEKGMMRLVPEWTRRVAGGHPEADYHEIVPGYEEAIVLAFLTACADLESTRAGS